MIDLETRPIAPPAAPVPRRSRPWPAIVAAAFLLDALLPWERWCDPSAPFGPSGLCFSARGWSGSASLLGVVALVLAIWFIGANIRAGFQSPPSAARIVIFTAFLTAATSKIVILVVNNGKTKSAQRIDPIWLGTWIGLAIVIVGWLMVRSAVSSSGLRRRFVAVCIGLVTLFAAIGIPYSRSGLAQWGGPLAQPEFLGGGNGAGFTTKPAVPVLFQGLIYLQSTSATSVTLGGFDLVGAPGIQVLATYVIEWAPCRGGAVEPGKIPGLQKNQCAYPVAGFRFQPRDPKDSIMLAAVVQVANPGIYRSGWFRVRYHAGVLGFELFRTDQLTICVPEPGAKRCLDGWFP